ncbi:MAG: isoprenylcysteine carboxylmethyltransferase family protein, partial [Chloroflexi bacterium]|nr:isoprenylcysteine carboxylmethyltransferase family protein [Chloroflexota bacterium]
MSKVHSVTQKTGKIILPPTYLLISLAVMIALHFAFPVRAIIPSPWNLLGSFPLMLGIAINIVADNIFRKVNTSVKPHEESSILVTESVFGLSRNPMYLGFVLILTGVAAVLGSLTPFVVIPVFIALMNVVFIRVEEQMLAEKFDRDWLE